MPMIASWASRATGLTVCVIRCFTLVASFTVIVILGSVAGIATFMIGNLASGAVCATAKDTVADAQESYVALTGSHPTSMDYLDRRAAAPANAGTLLKLTPTDITIDGKGRVIAIANNPGGCN